jgi:SAM-dependent methyltransferase
MENFEITDFRFASVNDIFNLKYNAWSRAYEYPYVFNEIINKNINKPTIHNTSWGYEGVHVMFRDDLDVIGECIHSDITKSQFRDTYYYDITTEKKEFEAKFDFVINVSTIEHLNTVEDRLKSIENLFKQVKKNGYLILTFDYPRVSLIEIESLVNSKCNREFVLLNGENSKLPNNRYKDLNIVYLILKKL